MKVFVLKLQVGKSRYGIINDANVKVKSNWKLTNVFVSFQCHELAGENEDDLDSWWNNYRNAGKDLYTWLCIEQRAVCCPALHYGSNCTQCAGFPDNICSGHGKCKVIYLILFLCVFP